MPIAYGFRLDSTYEGLKLELSPLPRRQLVRLDSTYEGLKLENETARGSCPRAFGQYL